MFRNFLLSSVLLGFVASGIAAPITFTDPKYSVVAIVGVDDTTDSASANSPPTGIPLNVDRLVSTDSGSAFASASAALGKLTAATNVISNVTSPGGVADASSDSRFSGTIDSLLGGFYQLAFNFNTGDVIGGDNSSASSTLAISLTNTSLGDLYNQIFTTSSTLNFSLAPATTALFDITLISRAKSENIGSASNTSDVDFAINAGVNGVPEPHEGMLLLLGGLALYSFVWRGRPRKGSSLA